MRVAASSTRANALSESDVFNVVTAEAGTSSTVTLPAASSRCLRTTEAAPPAAASAVTPMAPNRKWRRVSRSPRRSEWERGRRHRRNRSLRLLRRAGARLRSRAHRRARRRPSARRFCVLLAARCPILPGRRCQGRPRFPRGRRGGWACRRRRCRRLASHCGAGRCARRHGWVSRGGHVLICGLPWWILCHFPHRFQLLQG